MYMMAISELKRKSFKNWKISWLKSGKKLKEKRRLKMANKLKKA